MFNFVSLLANTTTAADALAVLKQFGLDRHAGLKNVCAALEKRARASSSEPDSETGRNWR